jgi:hypothetical protein
MFRLLSLLTFRLVLWLTSEAEVILLDPSSRLLCIVLLFKGNKASATVSVEPLLRKEFAGGGLESD